ncbi:MAG TPA: outer membrane beta-barrel protein [Bacteroidia bacterium]|nr:outer membrane beta-barrel protein [Bacteroidia bacterium]
MFLIFFGSEISLAQDFMAGVKAGVAASQISGDKLSGFNKAGIVAGAFIHNRIKPNFSVGLELLYTQKGSRKNSNPSDGDFDSYLLRLNYIEMPVLLKYLQSNTFTFELGPGVAYLLHEYEEDQNGELPNRESFNKMEWFAHIAMHYHFHPQISIQTRGSYSFLPVRPHKGNSTLYFNKGQYNTVISISLNYHFNRN